MDVKLLFTAVDNAGALASAASDKLEGVIHVIVLGARAWMFSSEDINKTVVLRVAVYADDRATHEGMVAEEDAAWQRIQTAIAAHGTALIETQADRLKRVNDKEQRAHQQVEQAAAESLDRFAKKVDPKATAWTGEEPKSAEVLGGEWRPEPDEDDDEVDDDEVEVEKPAKRARKARHVPDAT